MNQETLTDKSNYEFRIATIKKAARSELNINEWSKNGYKNVDFSLNAELDTVKRIDFTQMSHKKFIKKYESKEFPVVIVNGMKDWKATKSWKLTKLLKRFYNERFKIGEDDEGNSVYMSLAEYTMYLDKDAKTDDSPLYIFDSMFAERQTNNSADKLPSKLKRSYDEMKRPSEPLSTLLNDYKVPEWFEEDLFRFGGHEKRPPYRWFVLGSERSGTGIHIDPLGTSAWNALVQGHKRWCLFPPGTPKNIISPKVPDNEGVTWFHKVYPKLNKRETGMVEILQRPGEIVFVPGGWAHVVMNLDLTIAITQNFCSPTGLQRSYLKARTSRPKFTRKWVKKLPKQYQQELECVKTIPLLRQASSSSSNDSSSCTSSE